MTLQYPCQTLQPYAFITVSENRLLKLRNCADLVLHFFCAKNRWQNKKQCYNHPCVPLYTKAFLGISDCCVRVCGTHPGNILLCMLPKKTPRSNTGSFLFTQKKIARRVSAINTPGDSFFDKLSLTVLPILTVYPLQFSFFTFWQRRCAWRRCCSSAPRSRPSGWPVWIRVRIGVCKLPSL